MVALIIPTLAGVVIWRIIANRKKGNFTLERKAVYDMAMGWTDSTKLNRLAKVFDDEGLADQAKALRARAALPNQPQEVQDARQAVVKQALTSDNPPAIHGIADAFARNGAASTAVMLHNYADSVKMAQQINPVINGVVYKSGAAGAGWGADPAIGAAPRAPVGGGRVGGRPAPVARGGLLRGVTGVRMNQGGP